MMYNILILCLILFSIFVVCIFYNIEHHHFNNLAVGDLIAYYANEYDSEHELETFEHIDKIETDDRGSIIYICTKTRKFGFHDFITNEFRLVND